jgi:FkbM family methyltransferase
VPDRIRAAVFWHLYERAEIQLIKRYLPRDLDVIELGSSFGVTAAHALARLDPDRKLVAVEANETLLPALRQVLADPRAEVCHGAVAYGAGDVVEFYVHPTNHLWSRMNARPGAQAVAVQSITLGQLVGDHDLGEYSLIADIEGAEAGLLEHDAEALLGCRCMIIELHSTEHQGRHVDRGSMLEQVLGLGFRKVDEQRRTVVFMRD